MSDRDSGPARRLVLCSFCRVETNHDVLFEYEADRRYDPETEDGWGVGASFLRCRGCDWPTLELRTTDTDTLDQDGNYTEVRHLYPERSAISEDLGGRSYLLVRNWSDLEIQEWTTTLPGSVRSLYRETLVALQNDAPILAAAGLRAIVEAVCLDKAVAGDTLNEKIDGLVEAGILAAEQARFLHLHRLIGNDAVHELKVPETPVLIASMVILQNVLRTVYGLPRIADLVESERRSP